jgi:hypothetical protein
VKLPVLAINAIAQTGKASNASYNSTEMSLPNST